MACKGSVSSETDSSMNQLLKHMHTKDQGSEKEKHHLYLHTTRNGFYLY
jgi:hypothetical protein